MLKNIALKTFLRALLLSCVCSGLVMESLYAGKPLSSGVVLPGSPVGLGGKLARLGFLTFSGACVGGLVSQVGQGKRQDRRLSVGVGAVAGFLTGLTVWSVGSARRRLDLFNILYNSFLLNPLLDRDITLSILISRSVMSEVQSYWAMVRLADMLDVVIQDLAQVLTFGQMLRESKLVQALGDIDFESLVSKISSLKELLDSARVRREFVINHPSYRLQKEFYNRYRAIRLQRKDSTDFFQSLWNEWCAEQLVQMQGRQDAPVYQSPLSDMNECSLCGLMIPLSKRYMTRCACPSGRHFYHHECVTRSLKHNKNQCLSCGYPATVHSAFTTTLEPDLVYGPIFQAPSGKPAARSRCALCRGVIFANKAYKTSCDCPVDTYFYHHDCLKIHLKVSHDCPKCCKVEPTVHSAFSDAFIPTTEQAAVSQATPQIVIPTAPVVDVLNTCALCAGKIVHNKRYRTQCNCRSGCYYYHHLCIADTLKKSGNKCPQCSHENTTVHSAF